MNRPAATFPIVFSGLNSPHTDYSSHRDLKLAILRFYDEEVDNVHARGGSGISNLGIRTLSEERGHRMKQLKSRYILAHANCCHVSFLYLTWEVQRLCKVSLRAPLTSC